MVHARRRACLAILPALGLMAAARAAVPAEACALLTTGEIQAALGRTDLQPGRAGKGNGAGVTDCRFAGAGRGDLRIVLHGPSARSREEFEARPEILAAEGRQFERNRSIGDGAYAWEDAVEVLVGDRRIELWVNRTARTEPPARTRAALLDLARTAAARLGAGARGR